MKIAAVICEFNPFHNGHTYLLGQIRKAGERRIVCVMSGNVTQRGKLAVADKYTRAEHAIRGGADMVVELPAEYACAPANIFALGGVKTARLCGAEELYFGSECGDIEAIRRAAALTSLSNSEFQRHVREALDTGVSYPAAMQHAARICTSTQDAEILTSPNNMLGIEYVRAASMLGCNMTIHTVKRLQSSHLSTQIDSPFASSGAIRRAIKNNERDLAMQALPDYAAEVIDMPDHEKGFTAILKKAIYSEDISSICDMCEGLDNKIRACALNCSDSEQIAMAVKSKRYTYARISRLLMNIATGNRNTFATLQECRIPYINVLAVRRESRDLLRSIVRPVVTRPRDKIKYGIAPCVTDNADMLFKCAAYGYDDKMRLV